MRGVNLTTLMELGARNKNLQSGPDESTGDYRGERKMAQ